MSLIVGCLNSEVDERSKVIRRDFKKRYNLEELREQLYREQDGICAICKKWMQDSSSVICAVDHATSVYIFASWNNPVERSCEYANDRNNLVTAHVACNTVKRAQDLEDFLEKIEAGEVVLGEVPTITEEKIQELRYQLSERSRKAGLIGGRKSVESGHMAYMLSLPQTKEAQRRNGRKHVESGHLASVCGKGGRTAGRHAAESGQLASIRTPENCSKGGSIGGRKNVESGHLASVSSKGGRSGSHETKSAAGHIGGCIAGRKNVESGHWARIQTHANHVRWHVNRGISKPDTCALCAESISAL